MNFLCKGEKMNELSKKYNTYEKQIVLLQMMKEVDEIFRSSGIEYSLCGGSLLGAIREKGFIPWDDDIDIMVDRKNFNKLRELFHSAGDEIKYNLGRYLWIERIQKKGSSPNDLTSPTIDVFVMDNCPDNSFIRILKTALIMLLQGMMKIRTDYSHYTVPYRICLKVTNIIGKPFSDEKKYDWYMRVSSIGNQRKTESITGYNDAFELLTLRYTGKLFDSIIQHQFEDTTFPITAEYDNYLRTQYGDYLTPPKEEERVPHYTN